MNDNVESILTLIVLLALLMAAFVPVIAFIVFVFFLRSRRKQTVNRILTTQSQLVADRRWYPVRYASEPRFKSWIKFFPWEGAGILVMAPGSVLFFGEVSTRPVTLQFAPANSTVNWLGKAPWPNGAVSWFHFTMPEQKHYFSSETGVFVFGSHNGTKEIYEAAARSFAGQV